MKKYKDIQSVTKVLNDVKCDRCKCSCKCNFSIDFSLNYATVSTDFGYGSILNDPGSLPKEYHLCDKCYIELKDWIKKKGIKKKGINKDDSRTNKVRRTITKKFGRKNGKY